MKTITARSRTIARAAQDAATREAQALVSGGPPTTEVHNSHVFPRDAHICPKTQSAPLTAACDGVLAWRMGEAARETVREADAAHAGDYIDTGLILLRLLRERGLGVVELEKGWRR